MQITIKLGGTSVGTGSRIRAAAQFLAGVRAQGHQITVVTSAMTTVTDSLVALADRVIGIETGGKHDAAEHEDAWLTECFGRTRVLERDHIAAAREALQTEEQLADVLLALRSERENLERVLMGSHLLGELSPMGRDALISAGERMCVPILAGCLRELGVEALGLGGDDAGVTTDNNYGNARPDMARTRETVRSVLLPLLAAGCTPVVTGFYGRSHRGRVATLGRGGSDYSATLIGCALDSDEIWIMTDVVGIMTCDPRLVSDAYTIPDVSYEVAAEMALLGAKVLHGKCAIPAARQKIPLRIANTFKPDERGTYLTASLGRPEVTALTLVRKAGWVQISSEEGITENLAMKLIQEAHRKNVDVLARASGFNGATLMYLVGNLDLDKFVRIVQRLSGEELNLKVRRDVAVIGVVGERVTEVAGILATVTRSLEKARATPLVLLQGASPNSIVIAVEDRQEILKLALQQLHDELGLTRPQPVLSLSR